MFHVWVLWSGTFQDNKLSISTKKIASRSIYAIVQVQIAHVKETKTGLGKHFGIIVAQM